MTQFLKIVQEQLLDGGYDVATTDDQGGPVILFENDAILGFVLSFPDAGALLEQWEETGQRVLQSAQFALRRAERKAWNTYLVLLAQQEGDYGQKIMLGAIEENLVGTRKIAGAGFADAEDIRDALLPLLSIQNAPRLDAVDMPDEIRFRTSELPTELVEAFLSGADDRTLTQVLEGAK